MRTISRLQLASVAYAPFPGAAHTNQADRISDQSREYEKTLTRLGRAVVQAREHERQKLAEELHDNFGQDLALAKMTLGQLSDQLPARYADCVKTIDGLIGNLIRRTRSLMNDLYPQRFCEAGFKKALQSLAEQLHATHGLACRAQVDSLPDPLKDEVQETLFRAVRELTFNVIKHAQATQLTITAARKSGSLFIEVCDNGRGFGARENVLSDLSTARFGLFSVRSNLAALGGELRILSHAGKGTRAIMTVPIADA